MATFELYRVKIVLVHTRGLFILPRLLPLLLLLLHPSVNHEDPNDNLVWPGVWSLKMRSDEKYLTVDIMNVD